MLPASVQILAFGLALLGVLGATAATLLPNWKVSSSAWSVVAPVWHVQGLWLDCFGYSSGLFGCTAKPSLLALPAPLQTARAAMVLSCLLAAGGLLLASLGLKCTRWGGTRRAKGAAALSAGVCLVLSSLLVLVSASWFTCDVVASFRAAAPDHSQFQPGGALCVAFVSAGFLLAAGVLFCLSCPTRRTGRTDPDCPAPQRDEPRGQESRNKKSVQLQTDELQLDRPSVDQDQSLSSSPSRRPQKDMRPSVDQDQRLSSSPSRRPQKDMRPSVDQKLSSSPSRRPQKDTRPSVDQSLSSSPSRRPQKDMRPSVDQDQRLSSSPSRRPQKDTRPSVDQRLSSSPSRRPQKDMRPSVDQDQRLSSSPSRRPQKDIKDSYSLQEYV